MAFVTLNSALPNFDKWVELREIAAPAKGGPSVFVMQDGKSVRFLLSNYKKADGVVEVKSLAILNADRALYEWQNI